MKTKVIFSMFVLMTFCIAAMGAKVKNTTYAELKGNSDTEFGDYRLGKAVTPMVINNQEVKTYKLSYNNAEKNILIGIVPTKKCRNFIVKSDLFEIEYVCNRGVFGVKMMNSAYSSIDKNKNEEYLDRVQYFAQKVISNSPKSEEELLGLIACYFPHLIKDNYLAQF